ncbi:cytochrome aa3 quinol oxidase subunit II [Paenibacillus sp. N1-5-1-14]|uniref:cytochrome aa3 quinol oxidase subunit II n=1 Tax=Paenibacillus radicibacter TaxID=2972488 RepID=UPI00215908A8|nr:cytochrome aa3 quinol oxidase subunit II [Paenibacillus radicibacter]MCR8642803.1 cytochrome aa3 quinol oxidase subunit II [Paenibacillus radicibacter]
MKKRGALSLFLIALVVFLTGCEKSLTVLDPKGPVAQTQSNTIIFSMWIMAGVLLVVYVLFVFMLVKYRASKAKAGYEPPHDEGSKWLEILWTVIPVIIVIILSVVTVKTTNEVEGVPKGYENEKPLVVYAASSNWKWHFSYPEEGIETVNYLNIPTHRTIEFRLYAFGPISSLWIPQLGGQKYAMSDMVNKLNLVAEHPGSFLGKNSNFTGKGFATMEFEVLAMPPAEFSKWVSDVKSKEPKLSETEFAQLLEATQVGRKSYSSTHLDFSPPPEGENGGHNHGGDSKKEEMNHDTHSSSDQKTENEHSHH